MVSAHQVSKEVRLVRISESIEWRETEVFIGQVYCGVSNMQAWLLASQLSLRSS